ncbi:MAG: hypothetical protein WCW04_02090 [Candidatus Paceibacterota bacterium]|jgi:hypothetical protein
MEIILIILGFFILVVLYAIQNRLKEIDESVNNFHGDWLNKNNSNNTEEGD